MAVLIQFMLTRATFGAVICSDCGVVERAPYGAKMLGRSAASARVYLRSLRRDRWSLVDWFDCPMCGAPDEEARR